MFPFLFQRLISPIMRVKTFTGQHHEKHVKNQRYGEQFKLDFFIVLHSFSRETRSDFLLPLLSQIRCAAFDGHPAAQLSWEPPSDSSETEGRFDASAKPVLQKDEFHHTTTVFHTVKYRAELEDDDREITCLSTQVFCYYLLYLYGKPKAF